MNKVISVALEGIPGSGKTTLKNGLFWQYNSIERVEQILPGDPQDDSNLSLDDIIASDFLKTERIIHAAADIILLDRYYHSTLAYQYAFDKVHGTKTFPELQQRYQTALNVGELLEPTKTFYINTPLAASFTRKGRVAGEEDWVNQDFLEYTQEYYKNCNNLMSIDGSLSLTDIMAVIESEVQTILTTAAKP